MVDAAAFECHGRTAAEAKTSAAVDAVNAAAVECHGRAASEATTSAAVDVVDAAAVECHGWTAAKETTLAAVDVVDAAVVECHGWTVPMVAAVVEWTKEDWTVTTAASAVQLAMAGFHSHRIRVMDVQGTK